MTKQPPKLSVQILDEASAWFTELTAGGLDAATQAEFNTWLRRSPEHVQAYLQIAAFWEDADVLRGALGRDLDGLILRAKQEQNIYPLELAARADAISSPIAGPPLVVSDASSSLPGIETNIPPETVTASQAVNGLTSPVPTPQSIKPIRRRRQSHWAVAASVALLLTTSSWLYLQRGVYTTDVGEQRSITLDDGTAVELNALSRLRVRFNGQRRAVELLSGQALFRVAKDPTRPFVVTSGDTRVRAVGTSFDIYRKRSGTVVTVVEGRVAVAGGFAQSHSEAAAGRPEIDNSNNEVLLQAGEQFTVSALAVTPAANPPRPRRADVAVVTAWLQKKLVFEGVPLREVVEEFNRYSRQRIVIRDPSLYDFHVSGVFSSTDSARMLDVLRHRFGVKLNQSGDEIDIVRDTDESDSASAAQNF